MGLILTQLVMLVACLKLDLGNKLATIPFASLAALDFLFFWGIFPAIAYLRPRHINLPLTLPPSTILLIAAAQLGFLASYYLAQKIPCRTVESDTPEIVVSARLVGWGGLLSGLAFHLLPVLSTIPSLSQLNRPLWLMGIGLLSYAAINGKMPRNSEKLAFAAAVILQLMLTLTTGYSSYFILACFVIIVALLVSGRWIPIIIGGLVVFLTLASYIPIKKTYNWIKGYEVFSAGGHSNKLSSVFDPGMNLDHVTRRSAQSLLLQQVIDKTPSEIPYWGGSTLVGVLTNSIPRVLWKDKPEERLGNLFGITYGVLLPDDGRTSWNLPWLVEFYMNFGALGAVLGMIVSGGLIGALVRFIGRWPPIQRIGIASALVIPLFHPESNVSLMIGSHVWLLAILALAFHLSHKMVLHFRGLPTA